MCLGEIEVGVDLPPRHVVRRNVEYPSSLSECSEVKVSRKDDDVEKDGDEEEVCWPASTGRSGRRRKEPTDGEDELVVESSSYEPQEDGQTQCRSPKRDVMLVTKQKLGRIPIVLESTFLVHPSGDCESAMP